MAKRNQTPEDFIRDLLKRGFNREQILSRASKKDNGFYRVVNEILNHTTLIDKIEHQVETAQQSQINFEKQSYSSKTLLDDIEQQKKIEKEFVTDSKNRDNGRSNLSLDTDIHLDDLSAPLINPYKTKKVSLSVPNSKNIKPTFSNELTLFDEQEDIQVAKLKEDVVENKFQLFPPVQKEFDSATPEETSRLPEATTTVNETKQPSEKFIAVPVNENDALLLNLEKEELLKMIQQKDKLLQEINRNVAQKEQNFFIDRKIATETKSKLKNQIKDLNENASTLRIGLYVTIGACAGLFLMFKTIQFATQDTAEVTPIQKNTIVQMKPLVTPNDQTSVSETTDGTFLVDENPNQTQEIARNIPEPQQLRPLDHSTPTITSNQSVTHTVKKGETLWKITSKYLGKENAHLYKKVMKINGLTSEVAPVGKTITIPSIAELED